MKGWSDWLATGEIVKKEGVNGQVREGGGGRSSLPT